MKRHLQPVQFFKKLRSNFPRRRRLKLSPILCSDSKKTSPVSFLVDSTASSKLTRQVSCDSSSRVSKPSLQKRKFELEESTEEFRRVTRSYHRQRENQRKAEEEQKRVSVEGERKNTKEFENLEAITESEISCVQQFSEVSRNYAAADHETKFTVSNSESTIEQKAVDSDLACSERLCNEDVSDYYSSAFSDLQSEFFQDSSDIDHFSDSSLWFDSGSEFSERSVNDNTPSPTFSLFLQYTQQFSRSTTSPQDSRLKSLDQHYSHEFTRLRFEEEEHEMSYQVLRERERRQVYLHDYAEEYCCTAGCGELIIQQRLQMVHWMTEESTTKELQKETMFLGVCLLDRFLSKGFFKNKKNLQIVGIACLALATRIEENQPFNSVRQKTISVGSNMYSRCEVVAMEWLVQEVLNFQCFLPTIYNFLWFYLKAARANEEVEKTAQYLAVLALLGHEQLSYWPSTVAAGLVILASLAANQDASCDRVMEIHIRTKEDDLPGCIKSLEWLVKYIC